MTFKLHDKAALMNSLRGSYILSEVPASTTNDHKNKHFEIFKKMHFSQKTNFSFA